MIRYLLDTDTFSYLVKRRFPQIQSRLQDIPLESWAISAITYAEILFGLEPLGPTHPMRARTVAFLWSAQILPWPAEAAPPYALIRDRTRKQPIGDRDYMIAAHAIAVGATLVTNNIKHFRRIGLPLHLENWLDEGSIMSPA